MSYSTSWSWLLIVASFVWLGCERPASQKSPVRDDPNEASSAQQSKKQAEQEADWQAMRANAPTGPFVVADKLELPADIGQDLGDIVMSPDGKFLYVTLAEAAELLTIRRDTRTGDLELLEDSTLTTKLPHISSVHMTPDGTRVFIPFEFAGFPPEGRHVFERDGDNGELSFLHKHPIQGIQAVISDGRFGYAVDSRENNIRIFEREDLADPFEAAGEVAFGEPEDANRASNRREMIRLTPDGRHAYATFSMPLDSPDAPLGKTRQYLVAYKRDTATGGLEEVESIENGKDGVSFISPYHMVMSPDGIRLYLMTAMSAKMSIFRRDPATGELDFELSQTLESTPGDRFAVIQSSGMALSPDGEQLYIADEKDGPTILRFELEKQR
jgi:6-phosphogluconolactonase (cycloisomerase 2 family)